MAIDLNDPAALQAYLDQILGPAPPAAPGIPTLAPQGLGERVLGGFAGAQDLASQIGFQPRGFGQGLVAGIGSGLGAAGSRVQAQRAKLEQGIAARQAARDEANLKATEDYRKRRGELVQKLVSEKTPAEIRAEAQARAEGAAAGTPSKPEKTLAQIRAEHRAMAEGTAAANAGEDKVPSLSEDAINGVSDQYAIMGNAAIPPGGRGPERQAFVTKIVNRAYQRHPDSNFATTQAGFQADKASRQSLQRQADAQQAFIKTLDRNATLAESTLKDLPDTGTTFGNFLVRGGLRAIGSTKVTDFNAALQVVRSEAARILQGGVTGGGQLNDSAKRELEAMAGNDFTKAQLRHVIAIIKQDSENKRQSYQDQLSEIGARMRSAGSAESRTTQAPAATHRFNPSTGQVEAIASP